MNEEKLQRLFAAYFDNSISKADLDELLHYIDQNPDKVGQILDKYEVDHSAGPTPTASETDEMFQKVVADRRVTDFRAPKKSFTVRLLFNPWLQVAAVLLLVVGGFLFKFQTPANNDQKHLTAANKSSIIPGSNIATLTIANKNIIVLGNVKNGNLVQSGSLNVKKVKDGELVYKDNASVGAEELVTNTLTTPRGGQYQVIFEDGTKVWLNSASSISYPNKFTGKTREVSLKGEAYFEVAPNKEKPFLVKMNNVSVRVLGTHFNISAYQDDEDTKTTLLEGAVRMSKNSSQVLLKPGQQGVVNKNDNNLQVSAANVEQVMAWKNGYFSFSHENITEIMKKISRWYDVDVEYRGELTDQHFAGLYDKSKGINDLLVNLQSIGNVHFKIEGRRVIVMN